MIQPSIGRVVWFYPKDHIPGVQPLPAMIAYVHSPRCINVGVFDYNGKPLAEPPTSVTLVQPGDPVPTTGPYCTWMPFQVGQSQAVKDAQDKVQN